jgi:hypothetical protein
VSATRRDARSARLGRRSIRHPAPARAASARAPRAACRRCWRGCATRLGRSSAMTARLSASRSVIGQAGDDRRGRSALGDEVVRTAVPSSGANAARV